jgi:RNA polymerase sigma-70 factor (ECF subfamily)
MARPLSAVLLEHVEGGRARCGGREDQLESALAAALLGAHAAWPELGVTDESFVRFVAERIPIDEDLLAAVAAMRAVDLYLVCACSQGNGEAIAALDARYLAHLDPVLGRRRYPADVADEVKQILRTRLLVGEPGARPKITEYSGRGALQGWLRAAAVRAAIRVVRRPKGQVDVSEEAFRALPSPERDLELDYLKRTYGAEFKEALAEAFASLAARDRNLLRQFFGHGLTVDEMGPLYRVHRATVARWVARARETLVAATRDAMVKRLRVRPSELASLLRLIRSELEVSVRALAGSAGKPST